MSKTFIHHLTSSERNEKADIQLGIILAFVAGTINAGGFIAVGFYTSHMSGIASSIGDSLAMNRWLQTVSASLFLCSFLLGAMTCSIIINVARAKKLASEYALPLLGEALLLLIFGIAVNDGLTTADNDLILIISLLCFIMGLQNAIITKISKSRIRTTHITGITTDIGIEIGRYVALMTGLNEEANFQAARLKILAGLLLAFIIGGIVGAYSFKYAGFYTIVPLALLLCLLALRPVMDDLKRKRA